MPPTATAESARHCRMHAFSFASGIALPLDMGDIVRYFAGDAATPLLPTIDAFRFPRAKVSI